MTVVLWDIDVKKRRANKTLNDTSACDWSLDEYYRVAKRCICAFTSGSLAQTMLRNEDAMSFVAEHLMYGAHRWNESGGRTLHCYLNQCAIWSINRWILLTKKAQSTISLNETIRSGRTQRYAILPDESLATPDDILLSKERTENLANVIDNAGLTERQQHCMEVIYVQGQTPSEVARELGISRQAVGQCLNKGIQKIQVAINGKETLFT